ncbi:beta-1,3-galactosyl-O-glycosyl-glycoprotein beta-1,6-N-acetylglucosaminyltransferase-like [Liolophura sinensis]|uniref:beta-1,3-galactosyl-O-glycosyl-glycoprotein beta-1,6-N-acetylglucosaminyltransferase-like n=1 Tax=Liolophura sinensis TaxID=3198878 RepID=UPI0031586758
MDVCLLTTCGRPYLEEDQSLSRRDTVALTSSNTPMTGSGTQLTKTQNVCKPQPRKIVDCKALYRGENTTTLPNVVQVPKECRLENIVRNCSLLRLAHGYGMAPITREELDFPIAFSIKVHVNARQVEQLLRTVYRSHNTYCIHVDKKTDENVHVIINQIGNCFKNVHIIRHPINLIYASSAHVKVELELMKLCRAKEKTWKYYINLSGQDFPLKTNLEMVQILKQLQGQNDIENYMLTQFRWKHLMRKTKIVDRNLITTNETKEPFPYNLYFRKGSTYGIFSRPFVDFLLEDNFAQLFVNWSRDITPSEEIVWSTLNSLPWAPGGYSVEVRRADGFHMAKAVIWTFDADYCQGKVVRSVCVFGSGDLPWLKDRHELFANKFHDDYDPVPLDCLETTLHQRAFSQDTSALQWYKYRHLLQVLNDRFQKVISKVTSRQQFLVKEKNKWLREHYTGVT